MSNRLSVTAFPKSASLGVVLAAALAAGCLKSEKPTPPAAAPAKAEAPKGVFGTGTLEAKNRVAISPHSTGEIIALHADQGDEIHKGQLLVELFSEDIAQQMKIAEAELAVTEETVKRLSADVVAARATLDLAEANHRRSEALFKEESIPQSEYDTALEARDVAKAAWDRVTVSKHEAELTVVRQKAQIEYWKTKLAETKIRAPFDGLVVRRNRELGAVVNPGVSIMDIVERETIWASVWVDETRLAEIHPGQDAHVEMRSMPGRTFTGKVRRLARETDRETREHLVDIGLDELPENWSLGQRLEARIAVPEKGK